MNDQTPQVQQQRELTRADIAKIMADIAPPGEKREEKIQAVKEAAIKSGSRTTNQQNHAVWDYLDDYEAF